MPISLKTHKMLWGRAANRCAICQRELVVDATKTDDESIIGEICHIVAQEPNGARGNSSLDSKQRDLYTNLILLCNVHHKVIDDQPNTYTIEKLKEIKAGHEKWVQNSLQGFDSAKQRDDEIYASYIEEWTRLTDLNNWTEWSSQVLSSNQPMLSIIQNKNLTNLTVWLLSRIWPKRYDELEATFINFQNVLTDFLKIFHAYSKPDGDMLRTAKFYQNDFVSQQKYARLVKEYNYHVDLVEDLMFELTRAANYICDKVRLHIAPNYRLEEGVLLIEGGPYMDLSWRKYRTEYIGTERVLYPYPGLDNFKEIRVTRDFNFGSGLNPKDVSNA